MEKLNTRCGFISIIGRPNVGKSTLMNHLVGQKLSITSRKPQTTRHKITGVYTDQDCQYIFVDTPSFQKLYLNKLNRVLNQSVINSLSEVDAIIYVVEALIFNAGDEEVLKLLPTEANVILVVNKQDKCHNLKELEDFIIEIQSKYPFKSTFRVSAKQGSGLDSVLSSIRNYLPHSVFLYPSDQLTDRSSSFLVSEIIREKLFRSLGEELPYSLMVEIDKFEQLPNLSRIFATIIVERENQKPMIIGAHGNKLKKISTEARLDIEKLLGNKVHLEVWVKVKKGFSDELKFLEQFQ